MKHFRIYMYMLAALLTMGLAACSEDDDKAPLQQYGYAQFKVVKEASYSRAAGSLDKLADAHKVKVVMQYGGSTISQTLVLDAYNAENAEFGLRSEKIELMAGEYTIIGYYVYGKLDEVLLSGTVEDNTFTVVAGGLTVKELPVDVIARGMVSFRLIKSLPQTRASEYEAYPFANIRVVDINIKNTFTKEITSIKTIPVIYTEDFREGSSDETLYPGMNTLTSYGVCDTLVWLKAVSYTHLDVYKRQEPRCGNLS